MRSLRLEPDLDDRVRRAAAAEGTSVSEFLRRAAAERAELTLSTRNSDRLGGVIGAVRAGGAGRARDTGAAFGELLDGRRRRS
ncbi:MAG TPA: ribbon-helix-helix protein, CopG family [Conexibacter sp.]|nr:ribbon-helix-helix protein, CopG family [Conexibacter sp.]